MRPIGCTEGSGRMSDEDLPPGPLPFAAPEEDRRSASTAPPRTRERIIRRLFVAFVLILVTALVCWLVLPKAGFYVPPWLPLAVFAIIVLSALFSPEMGRADDEEADNQFPGR